MNKEKFFLGWLWIFFIGGVADMIKTALALSAYMKLKEAQIILNDNVFHFMITNCQIASIVVLICAGFLLLYYKSKEDEE